MTSWMDMILVLLILPGFVMLGSSRLQACLGALALQGFLMGVLPLVSAESPITARLALLAAATVALKGVTLPKLLEKAMRRAEVRHEVEPFIGFGASILVGIAALAGSFWVSTRLPLPGSTEPSLAVAIALFNIFVGFTLLVTRKVALNQVVGYLVLESGIYIFGMSLALELPLMVELGILLDVFVAVFVMGIMIFHISRAFDHIDTDRLSTLKE
ncbi:hydrogenase [bacterium]|nr:hydrogenase [bacterium]